MVMASQSDTAISESIPLVQLTTVAAPSQLSSTPASEPEQGQPTVMTTSFIEQQIDLGLSQGPHVPNVQTASQNIETYGIQCSTVCS